VKVKKHVLGTPAKDDVLVYEEKDDSFYMGVSRTPRRQVHLHRRQQHGLRRTALHPGGAPGEFAVLAPRARDVEYNADHHGGRWVIRTNDGGARNFKLMTAADGSTSRKQWKDWVAHRDDVFHRGFDAVRRLHRDRRALRRPAAPAPARCRGKEDSSRPTRRPIRWACRPIPSPTPTGCATATRR
jgi:oligopeptidase B